MWTVCASLKHMILFAYMICVNMSTYAGILCVCSPCDTNTPKLLLYYGSTQCTSITWWHLLICIDLIWFELNTFSDLTYPNTAKINCRFSTQKWLLLARCHSDSVHKLCTSPVAVCYCSCEVLLCLAGWVWTWVSDFCYPLVKLWLHGINQDNELEMVKTGDSGVLNY